MWRCGAENPCVNYAHQAQGELSVACFIFVPPNQGEKEEMESSSSSKNNEEKKILGRILREQQLGKLHQEQNFLLLFFAQVCDAYR